MNANRFPLQCTHTLTNRHCWAHITPWELELCGMKISVASWNCVAWRSVLGVWTVLQESQVLGAVQNCAHTKQLMSAGRCLSKSDEIKLIHTQAMQGISWDQISFMNFEGVTPWLFQLWCGSRDVLMLIPWQCVRERYVESPVYLCWTAQQLCTE